MRLLPTSSRNRSCTRVSSVSSGWNEATRYRPWRSSTGSPSSSASTSTSGSDARDARRADEDAAQRLARRPRARGRPRSSPPGARTRCARPRGRRGRGGRGRAGSSRRTCRRPARRSVASPRRARTGASGADAVDSPPGTIRPSSAVELLGLANLHRLGAEPPQHRRVLAEVALHRQDADAQTLRHRAIVVRRPAAPDRPTAHRSAAGSRRQYRHEGGHHREPHSRRALIVAVLAGTLLVAAGAAVADKPGPGNEHRARAGVPVQPRGGRSGTSRSATRRTRPPPSSRRTTRSRSTTSTAAASCAAAGPRS